MYKATQRIKTKQGYEPSSPSKVHIEVGKNIKPAKRVKINYQKGKKTTRIFLYFERQDGRESLGDSRCLKTQGRTSETKKGGRRWLIKKQRKKKCETSSMKF